MYESILMAHKVLLPCEGTLAPLIDVEEQNKFTCTHSVFFCSLTSELATCFDGAHYHQPLKPTGLSFEKLVL